MTFGGAACRKCSTTLAEDAATGGLLRAYCALGSLAGPLAPAALRLRLLRGREHPQRWREKLGRTDAARPEGNLVWLHGVGMGEVLALRGLIAVLASRDANLSFLVTSMSRDSAVPLARNLPPRTVHQYLPLDCKSFVARFLDHWRPDLSVWSEQDIWPCMVREAHARKIPLAYVSARIRARSYARRRKARSLYRDVLSRFGLVLAQEDESARHLEGLGAPGKVDTCSPLKASCPPLADDPGLSSQMKKAVAGRFAWLAASTHEADEQVALEAQQKLAEKDRGALLVLAPRDPKRGESILKACEKMGMPASLRSKSMPAPRDLVFVADSFGEMGTWFRIAKAALIGGTFGDVGGHNPWEAAQLGCAVLHGPNVDNFRPDFAAFASADAARKVASAEDVADALSDPGLEKASDNARKLAAQVADDTGHLAGRLMELADL